MSGSLLTGLNTFASVGAAGSYMSFYPANGTGKPPFYIFNSLNFGSYPKNFTAPILATASFYVSLQWNKSIQILYGDEDWPLFICSGVLNRIRLACGQYKIRIAGFFSVTIPLGYLGILPLSWPSKMKSVGTFGHQVQPATISKILFRILKIQNRIAHSSFS